ncbi:hypothetical protein [Phenylobacterium deserti]|uniref:Uncharacterized protein n=1 Tax=Phenylobacterium deserti TaxID=1914756 RepID=A0A328ABY8_9CAUL|nr:hypothetical protein [Phenylobacterium deserti]RAK52160.1 hypothetical protein DJ018_13475 [Phenylobacterium deserti]
MAKKRKKNSVPKRLAGVKIPKPLRKGLKRLAASQDGRTVLTEALAAAGAALIATQVLPGSAARRAASKHAPAAKAAANKAGARVGGAFEEAARVFAEALRARTSPAIASDSTH